MIRPARPDDRPWVEAILRERWGSTTVVSRGRAHTASDLPGLVAESDGVRTGLATYRIADGEAELVTLDSLVPGTGVGGALLAAVAAAVGDGGGGGGGSGSGDADGIGLPDGGRAGCRRLWLVTSNDNLDAMRFYQRRGMRMVAVHTGAVDDARRQKPAIPRFGAHRIAIRDEVELAADPRRITAVPLDVRRVRPGEGGRLREIRLRALRDAPTAFASSVAREEGFPAEEWERRATGGEGNVTFVAEGRDGWWGLVTGLWSAVPTGGGVEPVPGDEVDLVSMWVDPSRRGAGVGAQLIDAVVGWARAAGAGGVSLWVVEGNEPAQAAYRSAGFVATGDRQPLPSHPEIEEQRMALRFAR